MQNIPDKKDKEAIKTMFNGIADNYDLMNNLISLYVHNIIKKHILKQIKGTPNSILDMCCGTGDISILLAKKYPKSNIYGIDFSEKMLNIAQKKSEKYNIRYIEADVMNMPFNNDSFDLCTISFGLRNLPSVQEALKEFYRILKPSGQLIIMDLGKPKIKWLYPMILNKAIPCLGELIHGNKNPYVYLTQSILTYPAPQDILLTLESMGYINTINTNFLFRTISMQSAEKTI